MNRRRVTGDGEERKRCDLVLMFGCIEWPALGGTCRIFSQT